MRNRLEQYKVTRALLNNDIDYEQLCRSERQSTIEEIERVIEHLIPRHCGQLLVRIGEAGDGAYIVPDDLLEIEACFSPGVNNFKNFEDELASRFGIKSFMCDYTSEVSKLRTPLIKGMQFFEKKWLDPATDQDNLDINEWVHANTTPGSDLILQMDIEGAEYRNLLHASDETLSRFRIILLELHDLCFLGEVGFLSGVFGPAVSKLGSLFTCVHAHANNCCGTTMFGNTMKVPNALEVTFLRNDRLKDTTQLLTLPHALDIVNVPKNPPLHLDGVWLKNADSIQSGLAALRLSVAWIEKQISQSSMRALNIESELGQCVDKIAHFATKSLVNEDNLAKGKIATQSSLSQHSSSEGANGAINGKKTGRFGFHTELEQNPWWMVDLGDIYALSEIVVYNRIDNCSERSRTLRAAISENGAMWQLVYDHAGRPSFGGVRSLDGRPPLIITLEKKTARFVKLTCVGKTYFHLDEVEIYGTKPTHG